MSDALDTPDRSGDDALSHHEANRQPGVGDAVPRASGPRAASALDPTPARTSAGVAALAAVLVVALVPTLFARIAALTGAVLVGVGALDGTRRGADYGGGTLVLSAVVAGLGGSGPAVVLAAAALAFVAWDSARYGIRVGEQLGRAAATREIALVHAAASAVVAGGAAVLGYATYRALAGAVPSVAGVLLLVGCLVVVVSFATGPAQSVRG